ncbi:MAG TPA: glycosyltransferase [Gemmatimonadales bacterium]|nr:glycosyltransferase [Gemmatimonadales bacterium]
MRTAFLSRNTLSSATRAQLRAFAALGVEVTAIIPARDAGGTTQQYQLDGTLRVVPVSTIGEPSDHARHRWKRGALRRALQAAAPDVVHVDVEPHWPLASTALAEARRLGIAATVATALESERSLAWRDRRRRGRSLREARGIHAATPGAATLAGEKRDTPLLMAPRIGVVTPSEIAPFDPDGLTMAFSGRLVPARGLDQLFRAAVGIMGSWQLLVAGGGPAQPELETLAERLGISGRVAWLGALPADERAQLWSRADCAVVPASDVDAPVDQACTGVLQAMAAGRPVVATRSGALPEFLGDTGILVNADDPPALTAALQRLQDDPALRQSLGAAARRRVLERYSTQAVAQRSVELWRQIVDGV